MNFPPSYWNHTLNQINVLMPLISLMSTHFLVNSFTLISDMETTSATKFAKIASNYSWTINFQKSFKPSNIPENENKGYIVLSKPDFDFSEVIKTKPKLIVTVYEMQENDPFRSKKWLKIAISPPISFFSIQLENNSSQSSEIMGKCVQLYKPITNVPLKMLPRMSYGGPETPQWIWEHPKIDWNSLEKETRNMTGITIIIALVSNTGKKEAVAKFWAGRNSYFWNVMKEHLWFRPMVHYQKTTSTEVKSTTYLYLELLNTIADGLGVLPVITSDRQRHLGFVLTGLDSRYHLLVRSPQYVYSWQSIFKPFDFDSWISLALGVLLISIVLGIVTYYQHPPVDVSSCCLTIVGFVCSQGTSNFPTSVSARLVCYTGLLFSIIIYQFYTSNFYSLLSTKEVRLPFTSIEEFITKKTHTLYVHPDTAIYTHIMKAENGTFKKLWDEFLKNNPFHKLTTEQRGEAFKKVCKGSGAVLGLPFQTLYLKDLPCRLVPVNSGYYPMSIVTIVRKKFPFRSQFNFIHMRLLEAGITHRFGDDLNRKKLHKITNDVTNESVSLEHVAFLLGFLGAFILISWLVLLFEIIASKAINGKKIKKSR